MIEVGVQIVLYMRNKDVTKPSHSVTYTYPNCIIYYSHRKQVNTILLILNKNDTPSFTTEN